MAFTALFIAHAPDADPKIHRTVIDTGLYKLFTVIVRDQKQALEVCREMAAKEGVHSVLLCPGHSHEDIAGIAAVVGKDVAVSVARGDPRSMNMAGAAMRQEGWFASTSE